MPRAAAERDPLEAALRALNNRERSTRELAEWLSDRGYAAEDVESSVSALIEMGALDDERFARAFSEDKRSLRGWGPERIAEALAARGISQDLIDRHCAGESYEDQVARAVGLLSDRSLALGDDGERSRALGFLTRRGYPYEIAYEAIRALARSAG